MKERSKYDGLEACLQAAKSRVSQKQPEVLASFPSHATGAIQLDCLPLTIDTNE
ncbi:hypothetical protein [Microbulbifer epialgicus]|uniref:Uncharacterized protein n=1 Tax=Microbulbifer epialgicus TaxID=393907 RepID=A0ABV4P6V7_9GAMM